MQEDGLPDEAQLERMMQAMMGETGDAMPMMQEMMDALFSKEIMYPSLLEIREKVCV
jgi:hypothetical protein